MFGYIQPKNLCISISLSITFFFFHLLKKKFLCQFLDFSFIFFFQILNYLRVFLLLSWRFIFCYTHQNVLWNYCKLRLPHSPDSLVLRWITLTRLIHWQIPWFHLHFEHRISMIIIRNKMHWWAVRRTVPTKGHEGNTPPDSIFKTITFIWRKISIHFPFLLSLNGTHISSLCIEEYSLAFQAHIPETKGQTAPCAISEYIAQLECFDFPTSLSIRDILIDSPLFQTLLGFLQQSFDFT